MSLHRFIEGVLMILALAVGCKKPLAPVEPDPEPDPKPDPPVEVIPESRGAYKSVVILGVDGAGAFFQDVETSWTDWIFSEGASTLSARAVDPTISAQNWGAMLHGVLPEFHRLTNQIVAERPYPPDSPYPSIFRAVREAMPEARLASICNWNAVNIGIIEDGLGVVKQHGSSDPKVADLVVQYLAANDPTLLFVHFDSVDGAGHGYGYGSPEHLASLKAVDGLIGDIYLTLKAKGNWDDTLLMVVTDHGGTPQCSHGGDTEAERMVFMGFRGKTVDPETPIVDADNRDIAAIAAYALGVDFPETWTARVPTGVFKGVTAGERKVVELPVSEHRKHRTENTPPLGEMQELLKDHEVIAYLPFDGDATDAFGKTTTAASGKLYYYNAYYGKGIALDDGFVTLQDVSLGKGSFSAALWMKTNGVSADADPSILSNKDWKSGLNDGFVFSLRADDIKFNAGGNSRTDRMDLTSVLLPDYKEGWIHLILVVDRVAGKVRIYQDFVLDAETSVPAALQDVSFDALDLNIGQDGLGTYPWHLPAQVDEFILTADVLTPDDIATLKEHYL